MKVYEYYDLTAEDVEKLNQQMIEACISFSAGLMTQKQLVYRCRGDKRGAALQELQDKELMCMLYALNFRIRNFPPAEKDSGVSNLARLVASHIFEFDQYLSQKYADKNPWEELLKLK